MLNVCKGGSFMFCLFLLIMQNEAIREFVVFIELVNYWSRVWDLHICGGFVLAALDVIE